MATTETKAEARTRRGFPVPCIKCGSADDVSISLHDVGEFYCADCDERWSADEVREMVACWQRVLAWIDTAPEIGAAE